jgi:hypothetical protein
MDFAELATAAMECFPFGVFFAKPAPADLDNVDMDKDFCYFYFSPSLEARCSLKRHQMCDGKTNAKSHGNFTGYEQYFADDINIVKNYRDGRVMAFIEPWDPPGIDTTVYTRKTCVESAGVRYMLGNFELVDDVTLGVAKYRRIRYSARDVHPPLDIQPGWFVDAFNQSPLSMVISTIDGNVVQSSRKWRESVELLCSHDDKTDDATLIESITNAFTSKGFNTDAAFVEEYAACFSEFLDVGGLQHDVATYGIVVNNVVYRVIALRPCMKCVAAPNYVTVEAKSR